MKLDKVRRSSAKLKGSMGRIEIRWNKGDTGYMTGRIGIHEGKSWTMVYDRYDISWRFMAQGRWGFSLVSLLLLLLFCSISSNVYGGF
jgi:hypothetical protein